MVSTGVNVTHKNERPTTTNHTTLRLLLRPTSTTGVLGFCVAIHAAIEQGGDPPAPPLSLRGPSGGAAAGPSGGAAAGPSWGAAAGPSGGAAAGALARAPQAEHALRSVHAPLPAVPTATTAAALPTRRRHRSACCVPPRRDEPLPVTHRQQLARARREPGTRSANARRARPCWSRRCPRVRRRRLGPLGRVERSGAASRRASSGTSCSHTLGPHMTVWLMARGTTASPAR